MPHRTTVTFRGQPTEIIVDSYEYDPETNGVDCEWRFEDVSPEERDELHVTAEEESEIVSQIGSGWEERQDDVLEADLRAELGREDD